MKRIRNPKRLGFFAMLAALLGITAGCKGGGDDVICMYGVPTVSYELKGKVTDEGGKPVEGIEVSFARVSPSDSARVGDPFGPTVVTDAAGLWNISYQDDPVPILKVTFTDVDGAENGGPFAEASTLVENIQPVKDPKDKNAFNLGEVKLEIPVVTLKKD